MKETRLALIIANQEYEDANIRQLVAPVQDAESLEQVLKDPAIGSFEVQILLNESSYKVCREINLFFQDRSRDDLLLLYFSGHGVKDEYGQLYFATSDTESNLLSATTVSADFVTTMMHRSHSKRQVLLLDCCYSGAFAKGMIPKSDTFPHIKEYFAGHGRVVLTASDAMQYSFEGSTVSGEIVQSVFTKTLVQGLKTGDADLDDDGYVSLDELYDYVYKRVIDERPEQHPEKWAFDVQGKILIARNPRRTLKQITNVADPGILILDDEKEWLHKHRNYLEKTGFRCRSTHLASEAIKIAKTDLSIKCLLVDEVLFVPPVPSEEEERELQRWQGLGVIRQLHLDRPDLKFIMITSVPHLRSDGNSRIFSEEEAKLRRQDGVIEVIHKHAIESDPDGEYRWLVKLLHKELLNDCS